MPRKRLRQRVERDLTAGGRGNLQEAFREGEFVGRDVAPEENNGTPIGIKRRARLLKARDDVCHVCSPNQLKSNKITRNG